MSSLKEQNVTKCFSLLREFIEGTSELGNKKGVAILALKHLQNITAGTDIEDPLLGGPSAPAGGGCNSIPLIDYSPGNP